MKWDIKKSIHNTDTQSRQQEIITAVLNNRGLTSQADIDQFLHPVDPMRLNPKQVGIDTTQLVKAIDRIHQAIESKQPLLIYGDYDADGITATAILWEALHSLGAKVHPFIPNRELHGYGLSIKGLQAALSKVQPRAINNQPIVITVDNGITAFEAAQYLADQNLELIITDHHQKSTQIPPCYALVHTDQIAGSAVAWFLAKEINPAAAQQSLELAAIGTITDLLPLHEANRSIVKHGLIKLQHTSRPGLQAMYQEAGLDVAQEFSSYQVGFVIGPRLNAMGRLEDAMDSLRLLCTKDPVKAQDLAHLLSDTNKARQDLTFEFVDKADQMMSDPANHIIILDHTEFHEGVIGLIAGKLTERYHRPSIIISRNEVISKASARSIKGVNIIELIRSQEALLVNAGGHPQAAGFTIETDKIETFKQALIDHANQTISPSQLEPVLEIDCQLELNDVTQELYDAIQTLKPFGMKNSEPVFKLAQVKVLGARAVGRENQHLKLSLKNHTLKPLEAIAFNQGSKLAAVLEHPVIDLAFNLDQNTWNGRTNLQLRVKDVLTNQNYQRSLLRSENLSSHY